MSTKEQLSPSTDHNNEVMRIMNLIVADEQLFDVVLIAGADKKRIPAHRLMLAANSVYFRTMFTGAMKEAKEKEVELSGIDGETLQTLVTHCYNGRLNLNEDNVEKLLSSAHLLRFVSVVDKCAEFLKIQLSASNCLGIKFFAEQFEFTKLQDRALKFICENFNQVVENEEFLKLNADQLGSLLSRDDLQISMEEDAFRSLMSWVRHDEVNRKKNIPKLLSNVRISLMSPEFIADKVKRVCKDNQCMELYYGALERKFIPATCTDLDSKRSSVQVTATLRGCLLAVSYNGEFKKYCLKLNKWLPVNEMSLKERDFGIALWKDKLVVAGGTWNEKMLNILKYFDVKSNGWKDLCPLVNPTKNVRLVVLGESLYAIGGDTGNSTDSHVYRLNSTASSWRSVTSMPMAGGIKDAAVCDGCIYVLTSSHLLRFELNDYKDNWTVFKMQSNNINSLLVINGDLYGTAEREILKYNKNMNTWTLLNSWYSSGHYIALHCCAFSNRYFLLAKKNNQVLLKEYKLADNNLINLPLPCMQTVQHFISIPSSIL